MGKLNLAIYSGLISDVVDIGVLVALFIRVSMSCSWAAEARDDLYPA